MYPCVKKQCFWKTTSSIIEIHFMLLLNVLHPFGKLSIQFEIVVRNVKVKPILKLIKCRTQEQVQIV